MVQKIGFLLLLIFLIGCTVQSNGNIPDSVSEKYDELKDDYSESLGGFIYKCVKDDTIYLVTGSGGYAGISYYYNENGDLLGFVSFSDIPEEESGRPPVDLSTYDCTMIKQSKSMQ